MNYSNKNNLELALGLLTDSYKLTHWKIYPENLENMYSYLEARSSSDFTDETVFFGLQYYVKRYLAGVVVRKQDLPRLRAFCKHHFYGADNLFNQSGWEYIIEKHGGKLPVSIRAVPEGMVIPIHNVLMTIEATDPKCAWLTNFLETVLVQLWNPITVASLSRAMKKNQYEFMKKTVDDNLIPILMPSRVHDFGYRGVSSPETAALAGAAHVVNFAGTDNVAGLELITQFYTNNEYENLKIYDGRDPDPDASYRRWDAFYAKHMPGNSIPATEHSQMTLMGPAGEKVMCERLLQQFPTGFVACVSDSFDIFACVNEIWGDQLKQQVLNRNGTLVVRPDSGNPNLVVLQVLEALGEKFGYTTNSKGYKVLDSHVRIIQGDGMNYNSHRDLLKYISSAGWSVENLAIGSGGALLQKVNRDTLSFAFKCSHATIGGESRDVYKRPKTDPNKNSKRGRLALVLDNGKYTTVPENEARNYVSGNILVEIFRNGEIIKEYTFDQIKQNAALI
jgi:nicotinamide phosphoribosyltransferase